MSIVFENEMLRMEIDENSVAQSLLCKASGEECLLESTRMPLFSVTQERPFNNEVKLLYPNKRMTFPANRIRKENGRLIVGFAIAPYEAVVEVTVKAHYIAFKLVDFIVGPRAYGSLVITPPPVLEMRVMQLPIRDRRYFGEWLNVSWDEKSAVNLLATSPFTRIDAEKQGGFRIMSANLSRDEKLRGIGAALVVAPKEKLLDIIGEIEEDYDLPRGVQSRRSSEINRSIFWSYGINPSNVDDYIALAKKGGFSMMLIYYVALFKQDKGYSTCGEFEYHESYPEGAESLRKMLKKISDAGIIPGIHWLHTHIGVKTKYVTPIADHRLNLKRRFTLAKPVAKDDSKIFVEENPEGCVMAEKARMLQFGGEIIHYGGYTTERPYYFYDCERGHFDTKLQDHPLGQIGGLLDVSEFTATSVYIDQKTSLQDEVADKLAEVYAQGFKFVYFDGSEGVAAPYEIQVPNAQYRVYSKLQPAPLFAEGAAKAHFSWHMLSGGNAFDIFPPPVFKKMIARFPAEEAERLKQDFTRINFGWWQFWAPGAKVYDPETWEELDNFTGTQADMAEYGTSRAAAWNSPVTMMENREAYAKHPRFDDIFEVMRRWEDVRAKNILTDEEKRLLKNLREEHFLMINEHGAYELLPCKRIENCAGGDPRLTAYIFKRNDARYVLYWHTTGAGELTLPLRKVTLWQEGTGAETVYSGTDETTIPMDNRRIIRSSLSADALITAIQNAKVGG